MTQFAQYCLWWISCYVWKTIRCLFPPTFQKAKIVCLVIWYIPVDPDWRTIIIYYHDLHSPFKGRWEKWEQHRMIKSRHLYILLQKCLDRHKKYRLLIFLYKYGPNTQYCYCFLYFINDKFNKNAKVAKNYRNARVRLPNKFIAPLDNTCSVTLVSGIWTWAITVWCIIQIQLTSEKLETLCEYFVFVHCVLDLRDIAFGQDHETFFGNGQRL